MPLEIERKFLVTDDGWRRGVRQVEQLKDGLIGRFGGGGKVRVRLAIGRAWLTVKGAREGARRQEFEYEIPTEDAEEMLRRFCQEPIIEKTRHCVWHAGRLWSVDVHTGALAGLTLAEVELESESEPLPLPPWVGEEVTHDPRFRKGALLTAWPSSGSGESLRSI